ncbi:MAG: PAS domain S-box protein [Rhizobiaceae bacterium]|nr:PAS domain S-box protein [Rhizobiaceae bacterium]
MRGTEASDGTTAAVRLAGPATLPADIRLPVARGIGAAAMLAALVSSASGGAPGASVCFVLCGLSLVLGLAGRRGATYGAGAAALAAGVVAGLQLLLYLFAMPASPAAQAIHAATGGPMALGTATGLFVFGLSQAAVCLLPGRPSALILLGGGLVASGIGLCGLAGYALGFDAVQEWRGSPAMRLEGALGLWLLGAGHLTVARHPVLQQSRRLPFIVAALATPVGLFFDLTTPPYIGASFIYIPFVLSAAWFSDRRVAFVFAAVCALFTLLGYEAKIQHLDSEQQRLLSRMLGIGTDFIVAGLIYVFKRATEQNERVRMRFDALMDNSPDAVVTIDARGTIRQFNPAAERLFGHAEADAVGQNVKMLMPEPYHSAHDGYLDHHARTGEKHIIGTIREVNGKRRDGTVFPLDLSISELPSEDRKEFVGVLRDLSVRKRQEENLRDAIDRLAAYAADLERSNRELDDFAYIASHDLKEPLRGIHNHSRFLLEDYEDRLDADGKRRLDRLVHLSQRMEKLVNELLYFSRIGRLELAFRPTDIAAVLRDVVSTLEPLIEEKGGAVVPVGELPEVTCDSVRVAEIFRNLIVNALKYNDKAEKRIEIGFLAAHPDETGQDRTGVYFVRDDGKGIAQEFHEDIFRMFKRLERSDDDGGTGAGLTFVRKIVQRHGGHVWLESEPGAGTTFFFTLASEQS